MYIVMYW